VLVVWSRSRFRFWNSLEVCAFSPSLILAKASLTHSSELRNEIYRLTTLSTKQALLIHLPKRASLRPRSAANAPNYDDRLDPEDMPLKSAKSASRRKNISDKDVKKEPHRPFHALTQVCRQIRAEYRPIYMVAQEVGIDLVYIVKFIASFYPPETQILSASGELTTVAATTHPTLEPSPTGPSTPFRGNLTVALSSTLKPCETGPLGTDILPLLDVWANSERIEAGFGRYHDPNHDRGNYRPETDGEAKDLYRLFGRKVEAGRKCGRMNLNWRKILRGRWLAEVRVVRQPNVGLSTAAQPTPGGPRSPTARVPRILHNGFFVTPYVPDLPRPFLHVLFKQDFKEPWMTSEDAEIPEGWLEDHGFANMEHFFFKVGAVTK
jgi:hypothetical protein